MESTAALAVVIAVPIVGFLLIIIIVLVAIPKTRKKIFPFAGRTYFQSTKMDTF